MNEDFPIKKFLQLSVLFIFYDHNCFRFVLSSSFDGFHGSKHWPICNSMRMKHSYPPYISAPNANDVKKLMEGLSVSLSLHIQYNAIYF